eukprot:CAMPEP_0194570156 /NCGR_PEP_ID=MMETSP0292-20121207/7584_1 /TAXON_ID=39354 /ORGANISM="Heterosigma akashiwo, Strain CCMP2393" /LENGTH=520 /DNA_ID=CAMNT_0039420549 /DNA_START=211 /DNA_END=1773 /DNA_ORIENTATION=-
MDMILDKLKAMTKGPKPKGEFPDESIEELKERDPGIKVTPEAWAWPTNWPYTPDYFDVQDETEVGAFFEAKADYDRVYFDAASRGLLQAHLARHLRDGDALLELGAGADSYLPECLAPGRLVGVNLRPEPMAANGALTERLVQDLNAEPRLPLPDASFDAVLIQNAVEFFTDPLAVFREVYRLLKPDGYVIISFTGAGEYKEFEGKQIRLWRTMNDAQHMWIAGSYTKFSAEIGYSNLRGYELSPEAGALEGLTGGAAQRVFVVQAQAVAPPTPEEDCDYYMLSRMTFAATMENGDKKLVAARMSAGWQRSDDAEEKAAFVRGAEMAGAVYETLSRISADVIPNPLKAKCCSLLAPRYDPGNPAMKAELEQGLGLAEPSEEFWVPLGEATLNVGAEDKVMLIAELVPYLAGAADQKAACADMVRLLPGLADTIRGKCPEMKDGDVELLAVDLTVTDLLPAPADRRATFAEWTQTLSTGAFEMFLDQRKNYKKGGTKPPAKKEDNKEKDKKKEEEELVASQ